MIDEWRNKPRLFGLQNCNRDFSKKNSWGKNQFNSSFPTALACYMSKQEIYPVFLRVNEKLRVIHQQVSVAEIFGLDYKNDNLFFAFERDYLPYQDILLNIVPRVDLVTIDTRSNRCLSYLEIKLTALPDHTTCNLEDQYYGTELVVRPPTIVYLAASIAKNYQNSNHLLIQHLNPICSQIADWTLAENVLPYIAELITVIKDILTECINNQTYLVMQPIWKTEGKSAKLHRNCLDIFVWSNLAFAQLFINAAQAEINVNKISRHKRCLLWLVKMLYDFAKNGKIDYQSTIDEMSFNTKNDKAFALSGLKTHQYMKSHELTQPRITKDEIKNIILGGGEKFLSPERRLDAIIMNTPDLF